MRTARERQVEWELGRRRRQVEAAEKVEAFEFNAKRAVPVQGFVGRREPYRLLDRPVVVLPYRAYLVALRHRYDLARLGTWQTAWIKTAPVIAGLDVLGYLEASYATRGKGMNLAGDKDVAEWVISQSVHEALRDGLIPPPLA